MIKRINAIEHGWKKVDVEVLNYPDECPYCHSAIEPIFRDAFLIDPQWGSNEFIKIVYSCPKLKCKQLFFGLFFANHPVQRYFIFSHSEPRHFKDLEFENIINNISPRFAVIYNQAYIAERNLLSDICWMGYRKALEFLIKDYCKKESPEKTEEIEASFLWRCIESYISNEKIKEVAKRASWLWNDETHYIKLRNNKDVNDLKNLINITKYWILQEEETKNIIKDMPVNN